MVFCGWPGVNFTNQADARVEAHKTLDTHTRTACERRKRVVKGCVCRGVVDGPTRAARGTRMVLHMDLCDTCVCTCVYVCFKRTLHVMAWRLLRHGSERIHRSCRSRVASDLLHEQISFLRTSTGTVGTPTRIHIVGTCESGVTPRDTHTQLGKHLQEDLRSKPQTSRV